MVQRRRHPRRARNYTYLIYLVAVFAVLQFFALRVFHQEQVTRPPGRLFEGQQLPIGELTLRFTDDRLEETERRIIEQQEPEQGPEEQEPAPAEPPEPEIETTEMELSDIQKEIVFRALEMLEEGWVYGYELFPDTGYPEEKIAISTDVIAVVLRDCGYDLMESIYEDMVDHTGSYPMHFIGRDNPVRHIDFRHVFFQQTYFSRHALVLDDTYEPDYEDNHIQWQAGDLVYFQFDADKPHQDLGGIVSPNTNDQGDPLVIMISGDLEQISEVDVLTEYDIAGHYRYPYPEEMQ